MCKVCTEAIDCVALWTRTLSEVWTCVKCAPKQSIGSKLGQPVRKVQHVLVEKSKNDKMSTNRRGHLCAANQLQGRQFSVLAHAWQNVDTWDFVVSIFLALYHAYHADLCLELKHSFERWQLCIASQSGASAQHQTLPGGNGSGPAGCFLIATYYIYVFIHFGVWVPGRETGLGVGGLPRSCNLRIMVDAGMVLHIPGETIHPGVTRFK